MTSMKALLSVGLALAVVSVASAEPTVKLLPAGTKGGKLVVKGIVGGGVFSAIELHVKFDQTKVAVSNAAGSFVPGPGWATNAFNILNENELVWIGSSGDGMSADGTIVEMTFTGTANSMVTMTKDTNWADFDFNVYSPAADQQAAVINGSVRDLGGPIPGAPSTGPGKVVAVAAGTSLRLLSADTLADVAGFAAPTVGPVSGRPAFGMVGAQAVIAVGDDAGKLTVVDAATGASVAAVTLGAKVSTPAIATDGIYAAVTAATGPATLVKVVSGAPTPVATLAGSIVTGAPAVFGGGVAVGTEKGVESFRLDGTPQAGVTDAAGATIAPIIGNGGKALSANATTLLGFNALTGAPAGAAGPHGAGAVSEAWYDAATDTVVCGAATGILSVNLTTGAPTLAPLAGAGAIAAQPIVLGGVTYAIDATGTVASSAGLAAPLGDAGAKALAATGRAAGDSVVAATTSGIVAALTL